MKKYVTVTRKTLFAVFLLTLLAILAGGRFSAAGNLPQNGKTNAERVYFIKSLGLTPDDNDAESKEVTIPVTFSDVYKNYNALQKRAGYDLAAYKGAKVTVFTYPLGRIKTGCGDEYYAHLIVYNGRIIGGDISSNNFYGEMLPLKSLGSGYEEGKTG